MSTEAETGPWTSTDLLRELLEFAKDREWSGEYNTACRCHPEYISACPECDAPKYPREGEALMHEPGCKLAKILARAEAFLRAEDELLERKAG